MTNKEIRNYWNKRAEEDANNATTNDIYLRKLEQDILTTTIRHVQPRTVVDLGCGDAATTIHLAMLFPNILFTGMDYATEMLNLAARNVETCRYKGYTLSNLLLVEQSVEKLTKFDYDLVISCRCLINLGSLAAADSMFSKLSLNKYALIENFLAQHHRLNNFRVLSGLNPIPIRPHNTYLYPVMHSMSFADSYYYATRVVYAAKCSADSVEPDYNSIEHKTAVTLGNIPELNCAPMRLIYNNI